MVFDQDSDNREDTLRGSTDEREGKFAPLTLVSSQSPPPDGGLAACAIGAAAIFQPALSSVSGWFDKRRGAAFGVLMTGSSTGGVIFPIMITHLIPKVGYGWAMRIAAFIILFLLVIASLTVKRRVRPTLTKLTAEDLHRPLRELAFLLLLVAFALLSFGIYVPVNFLVLSAISLSQYLVSIFNAASLFGRLTSGFLGDKIGRYNMFFLVCNVSGILILALWIPGTSNVAYILFAAFFGFFSGAYVSLWPALVAQISPPKEFGYRSGLLFCSGAIPGLESSAWLGPGWWELLLAKF
ncbi:hypothetical protein CEP54_008103 [Fusarium duplospermum]|uniref:Major facilitator superfamily (MFS) profile domain-containing protein n=1 Tax=Fusarium duplospermum TaxID=1325734 RepID=A0A428PXQ7_9HYPO|nr:hypothetical protein CEP54_008103 [Fusarium duplospermum]